MPVIQMIVSPQGETEITTTGFKGVACRQATADLEASLGPALSSVDTAEAYEKAEEIKIDQQRDG